MGLMNGKMLLKNAFEMSFQLDYSSLSTLVTNIGPYLHIYVFIIQLCVIT